MPIYPLFVTDLVENRAVSICGFCKLVGKGRQIFRLEQCVLFLFEHQTFKSVAAIEVRLVVNRLEPSGKGFLNDNGVLDETVLVQAGTGGAQANVAVVLVPSFKVIVQDEFVVIEFAEVFVSTNDQLEPLSVD